jgi:hypothetical protein
MMPRTLRALVNPSGAHSLGGARAAAAVLATPAAHLVPLPLLVRDRRRRGAAH